MPAALIAALLLCAAAAQTPAREPLSGFTVVVDEEPSYYDVAGRTSQELSKSMAASGISDEADGSRGAAGTSSALTVRFAREIKDGRCALTAAKVVVTVRMRLPRWNPPPDAADEAKDWWRRASAAIQRHEDGHKQIDVDAGQDALSYIQDVAPEGSCEALDARVNEQIRRAQDEETERNVEYDRRTRHGKTQYGEFLKP